MRCANYRLICPNGLFLQEGRICEKCVGGREWWCFLSNCEASRFKSLGYALRNYIARMRRYFLDNVSIYYAQTEFQRTRLIQEGFPEDRICVIPNMVASKEVETAKDPGQYVGFVGRISPEKGVDTLIEAARACPDIQFKAAGSYNRVPDIVTKAPHNFNFSGHLDKEPLDKFYVNSRIIVLCSICYEGFPSVLLEAMLHGKPVISSRIGGLPEIVDEGVTGFLFEPGNAQDLAQKIRYLWNSPDLCRQMGRACREKVLREYSPDAYYRRLMSAYKSAIEINKHNNGDTR
jgi:glycosyltransferase involved in cell wall biosynthesis